MNKLTKIAAITLLTITAGTTLTACGSSSNGKESSHKLFEPAYTKDLTVKKVYLATTGDPDKGNAQEDLKGQIIKAKVDHIGKGSSGLLGYVLEDSPKDEDGSTKISFLPDSQKLKHKKGEYVYLKITDQTPVLGLAVISCKEVG